MLVAWRRPMLIIALMAACRASAAREGAPPPPAAATFTVSAFTVSAVRYATIPGFPVRALVQGADSARRMDIAMMVWLLQGPGGRAVLVDAGFYREKFVRRWRPAGFVRPSDALLAATGVAPDAVTDIVLSHIHWDHMDGVDLFPRAGVGAARGVRVLRGGLRSGAARRDRPGGRGDAGSAARRRPGGAGGG